MLPDQNLLTVQRVDTHLRDAQAFHADEHHAFYMRRAEVQLSRRVEHLQCSFGGRSLPINPQDAQVCCQACAEHTLTMSHLRAGVGSGI